MSNFEAYRKRLEQFKQAGYYSQSVIQRVEHYLNNPDELQAEYHIKDGLNYLSWQFCN